MIPSLPAAHGGNDGDFVGGCKHLLIIGIVVIHGDQAGAQALDCRVKDLKVSFQRRHGGVFLEFHFDGRAPEKISDDPKCE